MKIADALRTVARLFLDTAPVIFYVERNPQYTALVDEVFQRVDAGTLPAVTSFVTLAECLVHPYKNGQTAVIQSFTDLVVNGQGVTFVLPDVAIAKQTAELRARYRLALPDAAQVATALAAGCDAFLTNDLALKRVTELTILVLDELEV